MIKNIIYLHGFASSPNSNKAQYITNFFKNKEIRVLVPDLNCGNFSDVTVSKMLLKINEAVSIIKDSFIVIGSSMGGYLATLYSEKANILPDKMLLLAPGFNLYRLFGDWLGEYGISEWRKNGYFHFMHYAYNRELPLSYEFYKDLKNHSSFPNIRGIKTHIIHGVYDNVVPYSVSEKFVSLNPNTTLELINDTHELTNSKDVILKRILEMLI